MDVWPYFSPPGRSISYRESIELAGRRLPYIAGEFKQPSTDFYRPDYVEYFLVTGGSGRRAARLSNGVLEEHDLAPGELYLFRPMDVQRIVSHPRTGITVICVAFPVQTWEKFAMLSEIDQGVFTRPQPPRVDVDLDDRMRMRPFRRLLDIHRRRLDLMDLIELLVATIPWFVDAGRDSDPAGAPRWLRDAIETMHEEENLRAGVPRLVALAHVSHTHLWRTTRSYLGQSPSDLVREIRLHHASLLLASTDTPIASIADRCGYSTAANFSSAFRRARVLSPREYRAQARVRGSGSATSA